MQGKRSVGLPIGPDLSLLLAECLLARVDEKLKCDRDRCYRWFDDYELAFATLEEAEQMEAQLAKLLKTYRLALSDEKTRITRLPVVTEPAWKNALREHPTKASVDSIVGLFDLAYSFRAAFPEEPIVNYAIGKLFDFRRYKDHSDLIVDLICQSILAEPGCVPKAVALLVHYSINGATLDLETIKNAVVLLIERGHRRDVGSDIAWCLHACKVLTIALPATTGKQLSTIEDDIVAILSMDLNNAGLLSGWNPREWAGRVTDKAVWGPHWLAAYEGVVRGWLPDPSRFVTSDPHFGALLSRRVHFYRDDLPAFATVVHSSGAPGWLRNQILEGAAASKKRRAAPQAKGRARQGPMAVDEVLPTEVALILEALDVRINVIEASVAAIQAELFRSMTVVAASGEEEEGADYE